MNRILEAGDPTAATILDKAIGHPARIVLLIKGDGPGVGAFYSRASEVAGQPWRDVFWVRDPALLATAQRFFQTTADVFEASLLDFADQVVESIDIAATTYRIGKCFIDAEAR